MADVSTHYPGFYTNYGHNYDSKIHTTHTYIYIYSSGFHGYYVNEGACLSGSPGTSRLVNAESVATRNFTDNGIYMKTGGG